MRFYCILLLLIVTMLLPEDVSGWGRRRRRFWRRVRRAIRRVGRVARRVGDFYRRNKILINAGIKLLGRDVDTQALDANKDGTIDQSEAMVITSEERAARDLLQMADEDGDSQVTVEEFERSMREILMNADEFEDLTSDEDDFVE